MSELASKIGVKSACEVLNVPRSRVYWERQAKAAPAPRPTPAHALSDAEKGRVRELLNSGSFSTSPTSENRSSAYSGRMSVYSTIYLANASYEHVYDNVWQSSATLTKSFSKHRGKSRFSSW